jgi:ornithine cyclodeaminase/alanine dehydrogenase
MTTLLLTEADVERLLDMPTAVTVVEEAFRQLELGAADNSPRVRVAAPGIVLHSMSAAAAYLGFVGWKQYTTTARGARFLVGLYNISGGELVALIEADRLGQMRTGAVTGVAVKYLTSGIVDQVGLFGSGWQAESQLAAIAAVRPLRRAVVYSRDAERRRRFADRMAARLALDVVPADRPQQAAENLPIVVTATTSRTPVLAAEWLSDGTLVCAIGSNWLTKTEIDAATVARAAAVICDSVACCEREAGDLANARDQGVFQWSQAIELSRVVSGKQSLTGRQPGKILLFKSVGMAIEDIAIAAWLVARAPGPSTLLFPPKATPPP